jgi:ribosomal protein S18 acetylase RimI-like enzyme
MKKPRHIDRDKTESISFEKATPTPADVATYFEIEKTTKDLTMYSALANEQEVIDEINHNEVYFIKKGGVIVGYTSYQLQPDGSAYLGGLVILPSYQKQGIARKAIEFRLKRVSDIGRVWLVTHPENIKIIHLYESFGFTIEGRKENYFGDGQPRLVLVRTK